MALILIIDDDPAIRRLFHHFLSGDYSVVDADNGEEGVRLAQEREPDLVLLDLDMPGINGFETCRRLKSLPPHLVPKVAVVSAYSTSIEMRGAFAAGADDYMVKPINRFELLSRTRLHLNLRDAEMSVGRLQRTECDMRTQSSDLSDELTALQNVAALMLSTLAATRDDDTGGHLLRMRDYSVILAESLSEDQAYADCVNDEFLRRLFLAAPLHDIGKVGIPDDVLLKPGQLTAEEFRIMQRHTVIGAEILEQAAMKLRTGEFFAMAGEVARSHHERWDGAGYPDGLAGTDIPLASRIVAVADVYDALTTQRPYKQAWSHEAARREIVNQSGKHFDPAVVDAFERCFEILSNHHLRESTAPDQMAWRGLETTSA